MKTVVCLDDGVVFAVSGVLCKGLDNQPVYAQFRKFIGVSFELIHIQIQVTT